MSDKPFPWRTLLFVSVAVNLLVIGAVAGGLAAGVRLQREAPEAAVARMPGARAFMAALPPDIRVKMRAELADSWVQSRELRQAAGQARREAFEAASAEPYDVERVRAAFARLRAADQAAIGVFHDNVVEGFAALSPEERAEALQALARAAPASRERAAPNEEIEGAGPALTPEERQNRRERWRERRRERLERQQQTTP